MLSSLYCNAMSTDAERVAVRGCEGGARDAAVKLKVPSESRPPNGENKAAATDRFTLQDTAVLLP